MNLHFRCECYDQYEGEFCDRRVCDVEKSLSDYCVRENTLDVVSDPTIIGKTSCMCLCKSGFTGKKCESRINLCEKLPEANYEPCLNGGECSFDPKLNSFECKCIGDFYGDRCELREDKCAQSPCQNGKCVFDARSKKIRCECFSGWSGEFCEKLLECPMEEYCVANNTAKSVRSHLTNECLCLCKHGFEGDQCELDFDDCRVNQCKNGAKCIDLIGSYKCQCPHGFTGEFCETKLERCLSNPCKNGKIKITINLIFLCNRSLNY